MNNLLPSERVGSSTKFSVLFYFVQAKIILTGVSHWRQKMKKDEMKPINTSAENIVNAIFKTSPNWMEKIQRIRIIWAKLAGIPSLHGINLNVTVLDTKHGQPEYQIRGVVDVPSPPLSDEERDFLATILICQASIPEIENRTYHLVGWQTTKGGEGVTICRCNKIPVITDKDILNIQVFESPEAEIDEKELIGSEKRNEWTLEYQANRYCRFESRQALNQRLQDISVNTVVLKASGRIGLTTDENWHRLMQHVIVELLIRGQPPNDQNLDPRVLQAMPFKDGHLCRKAAEVVAARGTDHEVIVKYGEYNHMKDLYERGNVWINPATTYKNFNHNQAVHDDEREIIFKGGCYVNGKSKVFCKGDTVPDNFEELVDRGEASVVRMFNVPSLGRDEYSDVRVTMKTNYWMYCMAGILDQRLFADFDATACVIIKKRPFVERLTNMMRSLLPDTRLCFEEVDYEDPLGAFSTKGFPKLFAIPVYKTKLFRYAYQKEFRFVWIPRMFQENLDPIEFQLGPISDISEFAECKI